MDENFLRFIIIPVTIFALMFFARLARKYFSKPSKTDGVQKPGLFMRFWVAVIKIITFLAAAFAILGAVMREAEMSIVFFVLTLISAVILYFVNRKFDISYQETKEYFILRVRKKEHKVFYEQIKDWQPNVYELKILDGEKAEEDYLTIDLQVFAPEILLQKLVEMTFSGKFALTDATNYNDPKREHEIVSFLVQNNYEHLVKDYVERGY
jgi:hypothetical protein